jgi:hypothetical protein
VLDDSCCRRAFAGTTARIIAAVIIKRIRPETRAIRAETRFIIPLKTFL